MVQCTVAPPSGGGGNVVGINHALIAISLLRGRLALATRPRFPFLLLLLTIPTWY